MTKVELKELLEMGRKDVAKLVKENERLKALADTEDTGEEECPTCHGEEMISVADREGIISIQRCPNCTPPKEHDDEAISDSFDEWNLKDKGLGASLYGIEYKIWLETRPLRSYQAACKWKDQS